MVHSDGSSLAWRAALPARGRGDRSRAQARQAVPHGRHSEPSGGSVLAVGVAEVLFEDTIFGAGAEELHRHQHEEDQEEQRGDVDVEQ